MNLFVKNWQKFQHYKDRNPPWIKLATDTFQNYDFGKLHDASKLLAVCIWTLASRSKDGSIPNDLNYIKQQCCLSNFVNETHLKNLIDQGFLIEDSDALAECNQSDIPEAEAQDKTEGKEEGEVSGAAQPPHPPTTPKQEIYLGEKNQNLIPDRQVVPINADFDPDDEWGKYAEKMGFVNGIGLRELEKFIAYWTAGKGSGARKTKRGWRQAWSNWLEIAAKRM